MYALIENNVVTKVGELATLFPNTSNPNHAFAVEQGALEVIEGEQKDQRFYWVTFDSYQVNGSVVTRTYTNTPKALEDKAEVKEDNTPLYVQVWNATTKTMVDTTEQVISKGLKSQWIAQNKANANSLLASTDWMVIRKAERDVAIPSDVATERAAIIADCTAKETAIAACTTIEQLIAVVAPVTTLEP
tara:strand:+ start:1606 stop:2172 length:567 start_codon:yes stop_codon:yes gene_type:complete